MAARRPCSNCGIRPTKPRGRCDTYAAYHWTNGIERSDDLIVAHEAGLSTHGKTRVRLAGGGTEPPLSISARCCQPLKQPPQELA